VHTIRAAEFRDTQDRTIHFRYLLPENGGFVRAAPDLDTHVRQLAEALADPESARAQTQRFVASFVRPHGLDRPATPFVVDAVERLARPAPAPTRPAAATLALRLPLAVLAARLVLLERERTVKSVRRTARALDERLSDAGLPLAARVVDTAGGHLADRLERTR
jgi:hypothetical protein